MSSFNWLTSLRFILMKIVGMVLAVLFLALASVFLSYSAISAVSTFKGHEAKIISVADQIGKHPTAFRLGGLFQVSVAEGKQKFDKIYCLYPAWPDVLQPMKGDIIQVFPQRQPLVGAPLTDGWGWFIVATLLIVGLVMFEFAFLALMLH